MERKADEPSGSGNGFFQEKTVHYVKEFEMDAADAAAVYGWNSRAFTRMPMCM